MSKNKSTLQRNLNKERTGFREIILEQRQTDARMLLQQTSLPARLNADDHGYQFRRFVNNLFRSLDLRPIKFLTE
jgi:AraC-like DNA-binding protein